MSETVKSVVFGNGSSGPLGDDLLIGAKTIGDFFGLTARQVYHLKAAGKLPLFDFGGHIAGRKSRLREYVLELERAATAADHIGRA
jgi:hypothetical protein